MFKTTEIIYNELISSTDFKVFTEENENNSTVWLQFGIENGPSYRIKFISTSDNDNDVAVRVFSIISVDDEKKAKILPALNRINSHYRFVKFVIDNDNDINIEYDFLQSAVRVEASAEELIIRIVRIIDEAYPELMKALWT